VNPAGCKCEECPFAKNGRPSALVPVTGEGPRKPLGYVVVDAPNEQDAECGRILSGPTGRQLDEILQASRIPRDKLFITPAIACARPENTHDKLMRQAVKACRGRVEAQLAQNPTTPVLSCGKWAGVITVGKEMNLQKARGFIREVEL
jgi:uracil-DNA glycosylase family 4